MGFTLEALSQLLKLRQLAETILVANTENNSGYSRFQLEIASSSSYH